MESKVNAQFVRISKVSKIPARAWVLALLSGGLQILIFPKPAFYFLCWIAIVPLLYALIRGRGGEGELLDSEGRSLRPFTLLQGFLIAWVCGIVWYIGTCYWIYPVMYGYGHLNPILAVLIMLGFCLLIVPGVLASLILHYWAYPVADNRVRTPFDSIQYCYRLTKGHWMALIGVSTYSFLVFLGGVLCLGVGVIPASGLIMTITAVTYRKLQRLNA